MRSRTSKPGFCLISSDFILWSHSSRLLPSSLPQSSDERLSWDCISGYMSRVVNFEPKVPAQWGSCSSFHSSFLSFTLPIIPSTVAPLNPIWWTQHTWPSCNRDFAHVPRAWCTGPHPQNLNPTGLSPAWWSSSSTYDLAEKLQTSDVVKQIQSSTQGPWRLHFLFFIRISRDLHLASSGQRGCWDISDPQAKEIPHLNSLHARASKNEPLRGRVWSRCTSPVPFLFFGAFF
jgi:hypothetical protein